MRRVRSYYKKDGGVVEEYLAEHINECLSLLEKLKVSRIGRVGLNLDKNYLTEVKLSVVFHDLGKAFYENLSSFAGHEIFSTYLLHEFKKNLIKKNMNNSKILEPAKFAVAFHHHPMNIENRIEKISKIRLHPSFVENLQNELSFLEDKALSEEERKLLNDVLNELKIKIGKNGLQTNDIKMEFQEICRTLWRYFVASRKEDIILKRASYLTLISLVTADYIAASKKRGGETRFGNVIEEVYRFYFYN